MTLSVLRRKAGLSQSELAKILGVERSTVAKWETGAALPRFPILKRLATVLECSVDEVLDGIEKSREAV